ncbi:hypothetical protein [Anatilimnocola floriformis]|nr:hypothetical protein [Anatilimnocola floriformis]
MAHTHTLLYYRIIFSQRSVAAAAPLLIAKRSFPTAFAAGWASGRRYRG